MADAPAAKKIKMDEKQILLDFLGNEGACQQLRENVNMILHGTGIHPLVACPLKIEEADANMCRSFSLAHCLTRFHCSKKNKDVPYVISFGELFVKGCTIVLAYLKEEFVPEDKEERTTLKRLINFLSQPDPKALYEKETDRVKDLERNWCLKMAQHLFSQLSVSTEYIIDNKYEGGSTKKCPCNVKEKLSGQFGDTSFGCKTLWHGSSDLLFEIPVQFVSHLSDTDSESEDSITDDPTCSSNNSVHSQTGIEARGRNDFSQRDKFQMRAQVIGFGFYAHKIERQRNKEKYFLIPHIGFSKEKICYRFYDSENDILLEMEPIDLFEYEGKLSPYIVLLTWLVLNYQRLGRESPACLLNYKSGFHKLFPNQIEQYTFEIEHPCHINETIQKETRLPFKVQRYATYDYEEAKKCIRFKTVHDL